MVKLKKMKVNIIVFVSGVIVGILTMFYFFSENTTDLKKVKITQISGEEIDHADFSYKGNNITFYTESQGKGKIKTEIPKVNIPEARNWIQKINAVSVQCSIPFNRSEYIYNISYWRRFGVFSLGAGLNFSTKKIDGISCNAMVWF